MLPRLGLMLQSAEQKEDKDAVFLDSVQTKMLFVCPRTRGREVKRVWRPWAHKLRGLGLPEHSMSHIRNPKAMYTRARNGKHGYYHLIAQLHETRLRQLLHDRWQRYQAVISEMYT